jgi:type IV pilus assembly protein PilM
LTLNILTKARETFHSSTSETIPSEPGSVPSDAAEPPAASRKLANRTITLPKLTVSLHQKLVVGLDIGTSAVRASELDVSHGRPVLLNYGQVGLPAGSLVDGEIRDVSAVSAAIAKLWENGKFSSKSVIVGIAGLRAITREIDLPFVPDNEVDSAVRFQSEEVIPFPPDQTILSSQILSDYVTPEGDKMRRILVAAAHTDLVNGVIATVEQAGLTVTGVDLVSSALVRAIGNTAESELPEAIVSVGAGLTVVVVHQQGRPQFVRTIGSGGNAATAAISAALGIPIADAESLKRRIGEDGPQQHSAERAAQPSMAELVGEVRSSIQYFASLPGRLPVSRVLITGGGSALHGLIPMLESQVSIPVLAVSPFERVNTSKLELSEDQANEVQAVLSTPIGLALPEPNKSVKKFNLLPPEVAQRARMKSIQEKTIVVGVAVLVLLMVFGVWKFFQVRSAQGNVDALQSSITTLNAEVPKYDAVVAANNAYTAGVARRASVLNTAIDWPVALNTLISITPANAQVQSFNGLGTSASTPSGSSGTSGSTTGTSSTSAAIGTISTGITGPGPGLTISAAWITAIAKSPLFANPVQGATVVNTDSTISFPFTISVTPQASLSQNASLK